MKTTLPERSLKICKYMIFDELFKKNLAQRQKESLSYISLFSSAGVGCYGFKKESFNCIATVEILFKRMKVQQYNKKCKYDSGYITGDINDKEIQDRIYFEIDLWKSKENLKEVDVIIATPPCQGMSVANHKKNNEISRNSLIVKSVKLIESIRPRFFVFENVRNFLTTTCTNFDNKEMSINEAIDSSLEKDFNILKKVINFKDYGSNSSRTRTLVIGVRKDIKDVTPYDLFPDKEGPRTLRELVGHYKELTQMGEISSEDIYHHFRKYDIKMLPWIKNTREGFSAFSNQEIAHVPHQIIDGQIVINKNKNSDKYKRCKWDDTAPCIHTRNDLLASQSTIHPRDNRVFSIRELMNLMNVPQDFQWSEIDFSLLNHLSIQEKINFFKKNEINIRQSIGEAVPTIIFNKIAKKIKEIHINRINDKQIKEIVRTNLLNNGFKNVQSFIKENLLDLSFTDISKIIEFSNPNTEEFSAFYTPCDICYSLVNEIPNFENKKEIHILEPSVGVGNFLKILSNKFDKQKIFLDIVDIDSSVIEILKIISKKINNANIVINFINADFLKYNFTKQYDLVIGNPPFGKVKSSSNNNYDFEIYNTKTRNLFSLFIEKSLTLADNIAFILPKTFLSAPEYNLTKELIEKNKNVKTIIDYGENAFKNIKIETIGLVLSKKQCNEIQLGGYKIKIKSYITHDIRYLLSSDVFDKDFKLWTIYKNDFFNNLKKAMFFSIYNFYRDRQITKQHTSTSGKYRVLKSRNISSNAIINIPNYDCFINDIEKFSIKKILNSNSIAIPNLSYLPRACFLPKDTISDGSVALLQPKNGFIITENDLAYYSSEEFRNFYMIGRNYSTRSLNIDSNSINLFGIKKAWHLNDHKLQYKK
ncbi:MAG TPA: DNA cytosine methyltransferase [Rickettsia endosymbiont of Omalisus fontisbellaquei]|nr:DNA cytosine methyltransferase [Rickettsia endosymbiont of Omalisus fontisbellaquei]